MLRTVLLLFAIVQVAAGQAEKPSLRCPGGHNLQSCKSFQTMLSAGDRGLLAMRSGRAYVCFREDEDTFFVVSFDEPSESGSTMAPEKSPVAGTLQYHRFKNGTSDDYRVVAGVWEENAFGDGKQFRFTQLRGREPSTSEPVAAAAVNQNEVRVGYSFQNRQNDTVNYELRIERAPRGFAEDYDWLDPRNNKHNHSRYTGNCGDFKQ